MSIRVSEGPLPGQATLHVNASLDLTSAADLRAAVEALVNDGVKHVTVDLTGADVVDSTGLGALISALKSVRKNGGGPPPRRPEPARPDALGTGQTHRSAQDRRSAGHAARMTGSPTVVLRRDTGPDLLSEVRQTFRSLWESHSTIPEAVRAEVMLASGEVIANIIEHAAVDGPVDFTMEVTVLPDEIEVKLVDSGREFHLDLDAVTMPTEMAERGRGLAIALALLKTLSYKRIGGLNHWTLRSGPFTE